jgi:hypothetical protein
MMKAVNPFEMVAMAVLECCKRSVSKGRSLDGLNIDAIVGRVLMDADPWEMDHVQFPRLIAEIVATQDIDLKALAESMDLSEGDLDSLFDRANTAWESIKCGGEAR